MSRLLPLLGILVLLCAAERASACGDGAIEFEDDFSNPDKGWGESTKKIRIGDGKLALRPRNPVTAWVWNTDYVFESAEICVDVALTEGEWADTTAAAILFWVDDNKNYYTFGVCGDGTAQVWRYRDGEWDDTLFKEAVDGLELEAGKSVELGVSYKGDRAELSVNGEVIGSLQGEPPEGGAKAGLFAQSGVPDEVAKLEFTHFRVAEPE